MLVIPVGELVPGGSDRSDLRYFRIFCRDPNNIKCSVTWIGMRATSPEEAVELYLVRSRMLVQLTVWVTVSFKGKHTRKGRQL